MTAKNKTLKLINRQYWPTGGNWDGWISRAGRRLNFTCNLSFLRKMSTVTSNSVIEYFWTMSSR